MANHTHAWQTSDETGDRTDPTGRYFGKGTALYAAPNNPGGMDGSMVSSVGGGQAHENMEPYQVLSYCIALVGIYPSRS
jgi:microcystin-dependent protein